LKLEGFLGEGSSRGPSGGTSRSEKKRLGKRQKRAGVNFGDGSKGKWSAHIRREFAP